MELRFWDLWLQENKSVLTNSKIKNVFFDDNFKVLIFDTGNFYINLVLNPQIPLIFLSETKERGEIYQKFDDFFLYSRLMNVELNGKDNILEFYFEKIDVLGIRKNFFAYFELIPRYTNFIVCDENKVIKLAYKYFNYKDNRYRQILIGQKYIYPPEPKFIKNYKFLREILSLKEKNDISTLNQAIYEYLQFYFDNQRKINLKKEYNSLLRKKMKTLVKLKSNLLKDIEKKKNYQKYYEYGRLLQSNLFRIKEGMERVELENFFNIDHEIVEIPLKKELSPSNNMQWYFDKYKKAKRAYEVLQVRIEKVSQEIEELHQEIENSSDNILFIQKRIKELNNDINLKNISNKEKKIFYEYYTTTGKKILVGRNSRANDILTLKVAKPYDYWFHARDFAGSHVILVMENKNNQILPEEIEQAASIAAYYSKAKNSGLAPVDYTLKKYVKKPKNSPPGFVIFSNEKTVMVKPGFFIQEEENNE